MKTRMFKIFSMALSLLVMAGVFSCQDQFSEKDALSAQQEIDLVVYVVDYGTTGNDPVPNATVTIAQGGKTTDVITDANGVAKFPKTTIGSYVYTIKATDFTTVTGTNTMDLLKFRQAEFTAIHGVYSLNSPLMATIKGNVTIETDITNSVTESSANSPVYVDVFLKNGTMTMTFVGNTDATGNYSIKVPTDGTILSANPGCTNAKVRFPDLELNQTIAYNRIAPDTATFPWVLPKVVKDMKTVFSMDNSSASFSGGQYSTVLWNRVRTIYALAPNVAGATTAIISDVRTSAQGKIMGINFSKGGNYPARGVVNISFTSLLGGSGATLSIDLTAAATNSLSTAYANGFFTLNGGSGYPFDNSWGDGTWGGQFSINSINRRAASNTKNNNVFCIYPGSIVPVHADYGTGVYRPVVIQ